VESTARRLLVATPTLLDPNFSRAVLLMLEHNDEGAIGVVLNRPTEALLAEALPEWSALAGEPAVAFLGGPVQPEEAVIGLARVAVPRVTDTWQPVLGAIGTIDLGRSPEDAQVEVEAVRVFAGYAGWGSRQLELELARHDWFVVDVVPDDVFTRDPGALWRTVLRRQGGDLAIAANFPDDPSNN
jgi:putative transcriptional regulator